MPCVKPLVLFSPKYLLHHKPATSALSDLSTGTQFFRVIDDGKAGDNTRHRAHDPVTGKPYLLPNKDIRRVVVCSGQVYYFLSRQRRARRIRDIALVRLEQLAPFPHDILSRVLQQYSNAEIVWCQEEPKNMGAFAYVRPRLQVRVGISNGNVGKRMVPMQGTARLLIGRRQAVVDRQYTTLLLLNIPFRFDFHSISTQAVLREAYVTGQSREVRGVRYVGRPACASPATASASIHKAEIAHVVDIALSDNDHED